MAKPKPRQCTDKTKAGARCTRNAIAGKDRCAQHRRKAGRPPSGITPEATLELVELVKIGVPVATAARQVGLATSTVTDWLDKGAADDASLEYREFFLAIDVAKTHVESTALGTLMKAVEDGDVRASTWMLERMFPDKYSRPSVRPPTALRKPRTDDEDELPENVIALRPGEAHGNSGGADW